MIPLGMFGSNKVTVIIVRLRLSVVPISFTGGEEAILGNNETNCGVTLFYLISRLWLSVKFNLTYCHLVF